MGPGSKPVHLLVDSTGLKLCGPGEWLVEKHATRTRRSWRKLHIGVDTDTGQIIAADLTSNDVDDGSQVGPLLEQIAGPVASFTGDGASRMCDPYGHRIMQAWLLADLRVGEFATMRLEAFVRSFLVRGYPARVACHRSEVE
jgi:hypothetical protein